MFVIAIDSGSTRNLLDELGGLLGRPRAIYSGAAGSTRRVLQRHFTEKNKTPNKLGGRRTNFWSQVRTSTQIGEVTDQSAEVRIGDFRFAQKLYGGPIVAKEAGALTIPVNPAAYGRRAGTLEAALGIKLFILGGRGSGNGAWLAARGLDGRITVYYALKKQVVQTADPTALPPKEEIEEAAVEGAQSVLRSAVQAAQSERKRP